MRIILQRVSRASVHADGVLAGQIDKGLMLLVGFAKGDSEDLIAPVVEKIIKMRVFPSDKSYFDKDVIESDGEILAVSQFTLYGDTLKGRRPDFGQAMESEQARVMYDTFVSALKNTGVKKVATGKFGAMMEVSLVNDGPTTILIER
jgi:D-tyrosyl-tRNA(Tyr) deacylase